MRKEEERRQEMYSNCMKKIVKDKICSGHDASCPLEKLPEKLGSDSSDPYIKSNSLNKKVLSFELGFFAFSFKFLALWIYPIR